MIILALETTERIGSLAVLRDDQVLAERQLPTDQRTTQSLAVGIRDVVSQCKLKPADIELVATTIGPGSFTGLRIGVTAAKTYAYAVGAQVQGVNTLETIAAAAPATGQPLWAVIDAQRQQVFAAKFKSGGITNLKMTAPTFIANADDWLAQLRPGDAVTGPGLSKLVDLMPPKVDIIDRTFWAPRASLLRLPAAAAFADGHRDDIWQFVPRYFRQSAAEEKAHEKQHRK